ncbi:MAG: hypothetical protein WB839_24330, partial [Pseudolabrys sp.]
MKAAGAFEGLPRELRTRHNMGTNIARTGTEQLSKRYFQDRVPFGSTQIRGCEGQVGFALCRLALSFSPALDQDAAVPLPRLRRKQR